MNNNHFLELRQHFSIESARYLTGISSSHPCSKMHGHSFKIILTLVGPIDPIKGWVMDYNDIQSLAKPILEKLDHKVLNEVAGLENPTSENICIWIYNQLKPKLNILTKVTVAETPLTECSYPT